MAKRRKQKDLKKASQPIEDLKDLSVDEMMIQVEKEGWSEEDKEELKNLMSEPGASSWWMSSKTRRI